MTSSENASPVDYSTTRSLLKNALITQKRVDYASRLLTPLHRRLRSTVQYRN